MNKCYAKYAIFFALALFLPCAFALDIDADSLGIYAGGSSASTSFTEIVASEQISIGEMSSANYRTWLGWIYTLDLNKPFAHNFSPSNGSTVTDTTTVSFTLDDYWTGIDLDKTIVYLDGIASVSFSTTDCTASGIGYDCSYTETGLVSTGDYNVTARALDFAGNEASGTTVFHYIKSAPVPPTPPGPGPGSIGETPISWGSGGPAPMPPPPSVPCTSNADCSFGYRCVSGNCAKFFDVRIAMADTPIKAGEVFDFVYILKNPLGKPVDAEVEFWLEQDGEKVVEGREVVFVDSGEEKEFEANLHLLEGMLGKYNFVVQLIFEETEVFATKDIEIKSSVPLTLDLYISRLPEKIETGPFEMEIRVGANFDERANVRLNQVIMKGNEIVWKSDNQVSVKVSKKFAFEMPVLPPGEYKLVITATSGEATTSVVRSFTVESRVVKELTINEIVQEKVVKFSIIALLLSIAAILSWHYLVVIRFISPENPARTRIKFIYFIVFATAFFALLVFAAWSISDLLMEFTLNEFYRAMETGLGVAIQQIFADAWNYLAATGIGQNITETVQSIQLW